MKIKKLVLLTLVCCIPSNSYCSKFSLKDPIQYPTQKITKNVLPEIETEASEEIVSPFEFTFEPIDAVIPCHKKDLDTINKVVDGIRKNVKNIRRIIVVSESRLTNKAEWFDERQFPFTKYDIALEIFQDEQKAKDFMKHPKTRIGWIFQQFLKIYSMFVIPNISSNVLIVDADTIFLRPVEFQNPKTGAGYYNPGTEYHYVYFEHLERVLPGFKKLYLQFSGISHHMLFQRSVSEAIFKAVSEANDNLEPWKAFCRKLDHNELFASCMCIEYELYFNFVFARTNAVKIRPLRWANIPLSQFERYRKDSYSYDYLSCHTYMRD